MSQKTHKILLVEDERAMSKVYRNRLVAEGFEVVTANNGQEGFEKIKSEKPDIVLLDVFMPIMDGFDVLKAVQEDKSFKAPPIMIMSNLGQDSDLEKAKKLGAIDYLVKADFSLVDAVARIRQHLK